MRATREAYGETLVELGHENKDIVVLDADLSGSTKSGDFKKVFPERFFNVGIAEQNLVGISAGLSVGGKIPFASTFAMFLTGRAFEIIRNSVCYPNLNVKLCATHAGLTVGEDGASHQALEDIALMRVLPNMTVFSPSDFYETKKCIRAALDIEGPVYVRMGRGKTPIITGEDYEFTIGKGITMRDGKDLTIIATGVMVSKAIEAAKILEKEGISARVINIHTIKPLDEDIIIKAAKETGKIITAEEHSIHGGLGSVVAEVVSERCPVMVRKIGVDDKFGKSGDGSLLLKEYGLSAENIAKIAKEMEG